MWKARTVTAAAVLLLVGVGAFAKTLTHKSEGAKISPPASVAVLLTANDPALLRVVEDALTIGLENKGFKTVNRETLEKKLGEQVTLQQKQEDSSTINAIEVGKAVEADFVITGTVVLSQQEKRPMISTASFHAMNVKTGLVAVGVVFDYDEPVTITAATEEYVQLLADLK